jgi:osmotically-inducible protein OsmY
MRSGKHVDITLPRPIEARRRAGAGRIALAALAGAALMYFLDPDRGRRRRAMARDRVLAAARRAGRGVERAEHYAAATTAGQVERLTAAQPADRRAPNDATLAQRVESVLFRDPAVPKGKLNVSVEEGVVVLRGEVDEPEQIAALERAARDVAGVRGVENLLHLPHTRAPHTPGGLEAR